MSVTIYLLFLYICHCFFVLFWLSFSVWKLVRHFIGHQCLTVPVLAAVTFIIIRVAFDHQ